MLWVFKSGNRIRIFLWVVLLYQIEGALTNYNSYSDVVL